MYEANILLKERYPDDKMIKKMIDGSYKKQDKGFYVYAKADISDNDDEITKKINSKNVRGCVSYMIRYASRPATAQSRITCCNKESDDVSWYYEDHKTEEKISVDEKGPDLLKKMIIHIPDKGFRMIRYYGFYNSKC